MCFSTMQPEYAMLKAGTKTGSRLWSLIPAGTPNMRERFSMIDRLYSSSGAG